VAHWAATVRRITLNHPGGAQGFRNRRRRRTSVAYLTDNELTAENAKTSIEELAACPRL